LRPYLLGDAEVDELERTLHEHEVSGLQVRLVAAQLKIESEIEAKLKQN
jgi:hypothetical protein